MAEKFKLEELAESIVASGYRPFDPLIGARQKNQIVVLEGNRRVAAIKLLLNPDLGPEKIRPRWRALAARLTADARDKMSKLDITVYPNRDDVDVESYIGFRHVTGVLPWPAFEKASYIAKMVADRLSYDEIAERLGSYPSHVERHYIAYRLVRQAIEEEIVGADRMEQFFGVLLRALQAPDIAEFLGVTFPKDAAKSRSPIDKKHIGALQDFVRWTFGTDDQTRVVSDSRQLTKWGKILNSADAVRYLRSASAPSFDRAWYKSGGQAESLVEALHAAADRLEESVPTISKTYARDPDVVEGVRRCTQYLVKILRYFPSLAKKYNIDTSDV